MVTAAFLSLIANACGDDSAGTSGSIDGGLVYDSAQAEAGFGGDPLDAGLPSDFRHDGSIRDDDSAATSGSIDGGPVYDSAQAGGRAGDGPFDVGPPSDSGQDGSVRDVSLSNDASCASFIACGGSVVGAWRRPATITCGTLGSETSTCPGASVVDQRSQSGTLTFNADGTMSSTWVQTGHYSWSYPLSCLSGRSCAAQEAQFTAPDAGATGSCVEEDSGLCVCDLEVSSFVSEQGSYSATGGRLVWFTLSNYLSDPMDYCVQGDSLSTRLPGIGTSGPYVLTYARQ